MGEFRAELAKRDEMSQELADNVGTLAKLLTESRMNIMSPGMAARKFVYILGPILGAVFCPTHPLPAHHNLNITHWIWIWILPTDPCHLLDPDWYFLHPYIPGNVTC